MSLINTLTLPKINASAEQHQYQNLNDVRSMILNYWLGNVNSFKQNYLETSKFISDNTGLIANFKKLFGWQPPDLTQHRNYLIIIKELIDLYESRKKWLMSDEFFNNITGICPVCLESLIGQPIIITDCLHPVCSRCFIDLCRNYATYQCPMRCHIIKYVYPLIINISKHRAITN